VKILLLGLLFGVVANAGDVPDFRYGDKVTILAERNMYLTFHKCANVGVVANIVEWNLTEKTQRYDVSVNCEGVAGVTVRATNKELKLNLED